MGKQWARQEIKRNELMEAGGWALTWARANRRVALSLAGGAVAVLVAAGVAWARLSMLRREAWEKLAVAQSYAYQGQAQTAQEQLQALIEGPSRPAAYATIFSGDLNFKQGRYKEAAQIYQKVLDRQGAKALMPIALADQALAQEAAGDCKASIETNQRFVDTYQDHFLAPQAHASMARCLTSLGQPQQAKSTLDRIALLYPDTYWAQWAKNRAAPAPKAP